MATAHALTLPPGPAAAPAPQANRIETVVAVVDAIAAGCDTAKAIGDGIGMHQRQGGYYAHAAATLGFVTVNETVTPHEWTLTATGAQVAEMTAAERARALTGALLALPELEVFADSDGAAVADLITADGYARTTAGRRRATVTAWAEFATKPPADQVAALAEVMTTAGRYAPAAAAARAAEKRAAAAAAVTYGQTCPRCFMQMSLTGECSSCD